MLWTLIYQPEPCVTHCIREFLVPTWKPLLESISHFHWNFPKQSRPLLLYLDFGSTVFRSLTPNPSPNASRIEWGALAVAPLAAVSRPTFLRSVMENLRRDLNFCFSARQRACCRIAGIRVLGSMAWRCHWTVHNAYEVQVYLVWGDLKQPTIVEITFLATHFLHSSMHQWIILRGVSLLHLHTILTHLGIPIYLLRRTSLSN
jgi:hypothetical protein